MSRSGITILLVLIASTLCAAANKTPTTTNTPAKPKLLWGASKAGLQLSLSQDAPAIVDENGDKKLHVRVTMRNVGMLGVRLGDGTGAFAWLTVVHSRDEAWLTAKIPVTDILAGWPAELAAGKGLKSRPFDAASLQTYPYSLRKRILTNYLGLRSPKNGDGGDKKLPAPAGRLGRVISQGKLVVLCRLYIPRPGRGPLVLSSNKLSITAAPPSLGAMTPQAQRAYLEKLVTSFDKDPWAGQSAHGAAVKIGPAAVPYLIKAVFERNRPAHARMWLATTLADIRDERATAALIALLGDPLAGVRQVVAYHGPKQRNSKLDDAIVAETLKLKESRMTALAVLGFLIARGQVRDELLAVSLESDDPRVRTTAAQALSYHASIDNIKRLASLLKDKDPKVRGAAATALGAMAQRGAKIIDALVAGLSLPGDYAKYRICKALTALTGQKMPYDPQASQRRRDKTVEAWKDWWKQNRPDRLKR